jgi:hypothetical protein
MALLRTALALLLAFTLLGCVRDPLEIHDLEPQLMVHGLLEAGADTVILFVSEIRVSNRGATTRTRGVSGATVELSGGGSTLRLQEVTSGVERCPLPPGNPWMYDPNPDTRTFGCYVGLVPGGLRAGTGYELHVALPDGRMIRGAAEMPAIPELLQPDGVLRLDAVPSSRSSIETLETVVLRWQVDRRTAMVVVSAWSETAFRGGGPEPGFTCDAVLEARYRDQWGEEVFDPQRVDSVRQKVVVRGCGEGGSPAVYREVKPDSVHVQLRVAAYDSAFARHLDLLRSPGSVRFREAAIGLDGAVGIFAATAAADRRVVVIRRDW